MAIVRVNADRKIVAKAGAGVAIAGLTHNPIPAVMPLIELLAGARGRRSDHLRRRALERFERSSRSLTADERSAVLTWAEDAVAASGFDALRAIEAGFDEHHAAGDVARNLSPDLDPREQRWARQALVAYMQVYFAELEKNPADLIKALGTILMHDREDRLADAALRSSQLPERVNDSLAVALQSRALLDPVRESVARVPYLPEALEALLPRIVDSWEQRLSEALSTVCVAAESRAAKAACEPLEDLRERLVRLSALESWFDLRGDAVKTAVTSCFSLLDTEEQHFAAGGDLRTSLGWIETQAVHPEFRVVCGLHGSWGSGKSRLVDEFLQSRRGSVNELALIVDQRAATVEMALYQAVEAATGLAVKSWAEIEKLADQYEAVWFVIDDADVTLRCGDDWVEQFVACVVTGLRARVRWLVTIDESSTPTVMSARGVNWARYGVHSDGVFGDIAGWFDLDAFNGLHRVGRRLLAAANGTNDSVGILDGLTGLEGPALSAAERRSMDHPLTCLLRAGLVEKAPVDELHLTAVFETYWALACAELGRRVGAVPDLIDEVAAFISQCELAGRPVVADSIANEIEEHSEAGSADARALRRRLTRTDARLATNAALEALLQGGLLDSEADLVRPSATTATLWAYLHARHLIGSGQGALAEHGALVDDRAASPWNSALETLTLLHLAGTPSAATALRFVFLSAADQPTGHDALNSPADALSLWRTGLDEDGFPTRVVWQTAPVLHAADFMRVVRHALDGTTPHEEDLYWVLRVVRLRKSSVKSLKTILALLRRYLVWVTPSGLTDYAALVVGHVIDDVDWCQHERLDQMLRDFNDLDSQGLASSVAERIARKIDFRSEQNRRTWMTALRNLLARAPSPDPSECLENAPFSRMPFWLALTRSSFDQLAHEVDASHFLDLLDDVGWWPESENEVFRLIRRETHTALGHTARNDYTAFASVVSTLARRARTGSLPSAWQPVAAAFAIRHSTRTGGQAVLSVNGELEPVVARLRADRSLAPGVRHMLEALSFKPA